MDEGGLRRLHPDDIHKIADLVQSRIRIPKDGRTPVKGVDYDDGRRGKDADMPALQRQVANFLAALPKPKDGEGKPGRNGWSPMLAVVEDGARRVLRIIGWFGGNGPEPPTGYLGPHGLTDEISEATNIRGAPGPREESSGASDAGLKKLIRSLTMSQADIISLIEAGTMEDFDPVYLDDQESDGSVLVFTFAAPVQKVWVELLAADADDTSEGRCRVDGVDPDDDTGTPLHAGQTQPITAETSEVRVKAPTGKTVSVYGYRRRDA